MNNLSWTQQLGLDTNKIYYLASPYSHIDPERMAKRYEAIDAIGAFLCLEDIILIEPISMCHQKSLSFDMPTGYEYWKRRDRTFVRLSEGLIAACIEGWQESKGMQDEIAYAHELGKDVIYLTEANMPEELLEIIYQIYEADRGSIL